MWEGWQLLACVQVTHQRDAMSALRSGYPGVAIMRWTVIPCLSVLLQTVQCRTGTQPGYLLRIVGVKNLDVGNAAIDVMYGDAYGVCWSDAGSTDRKSI